MNIVKRLSSESANGLQCVTNANCPGAFELSSGDIAFIGQEAPDYLTGDLPIGSGVGPGERLVIVPRAVLIDAGWNL